MKHLAGRTDYQDRLERVTAYIHDHLDDDLDLQKLADVACLSPYHWHRIYHAVYGETAVEAVKRLRLQRAATQLAQTEMPIAEIARRSGYGSLPSFTRIFKSVFGMPPARFRAAGSHTRFKPDPDGRRGAVFDVEVTTKPALALACIQHSGPYLEIGRAFDKLFGLAAARNLVSPSTRLVGVYLDDPTCVPQAKLRALAGIVIEAGTPVAAPLERATIGGGPCAVLRHQGPYADMKAAYQWLFGEWLTGSGEEAEDAPIFEEYLNSPRDTAPTQLLTNIHLPLRRHGATDENEKILGR
jgi:AraC family transcriptional regulator